MAEEVQLSGLALEVLDVLPAHLCVLGAGGEILWVNRAWREFAAENGGLPERTGIGSNYLQACRPAEEGQGAVEPEMLQRETLCIFTGALREVLLGRRARAEVEYPCHSPQEQRWFVVEACAMNGPGPARAVAAHHPITLRRLADMRQREELRLQALGTLASGIAHDFNNLLAVIEGRSRMLAKDLGREHQAAAHVDALRLASERARSLVGKILAFGRGEVGEPRVCDLVPIVHDAVDLFKLGLPAGVRLVTEIEPRPLMTLADATEVTQVVLNLCRNAADALPESQGQITVQLHAARTPVPQVELCVVDDGVGIEDKLRERIFEPFFSTKQRGQGTGLGLAIVHGIVNRLGGQLEVTSRPRQGSRFSIRLPRVAAPEGANPVAPPGAPPPRRAAGVRTPRVLMVDDDEVVGLVVETFLRRTGYAVQRLAAPAAVLDLLRSGFADVDLVLSDQTMPGLSGVELARQIHQLAPSLPVLLMSGYVDDELQAHLKSAGGHSVVRKERLFDDLPVLLNRLLAPAA